jgi:hypothetical protein
MGWYSGSYLAADIYKLVRKHIPEDKRKAIAGKIIDRFEQEDADDWDSGSLLCKDAGKYQGDPEDEDGWDYKPHVI